MYGVKVRKVNTLNVFGKKGKAKKAYIRLENDSEALNIASKIGILWFNLFLLNNKFYKPLL